jgi:hypothetical protein
MTKLNKKGITMVTLTVAITLMVIITSTLIYNITTGAYVKSLNNMYNDIEKLEDKISIYYSKYNTIPIIKTKYENVDEIKTLNENDNDNYYVIDLAAFDNLDLTYGQDYYLYQSVPSNDLTDLYIVNERSHNVYYVKGISFDDKIYYTEPTQSSKVVLSPYLNLEVTDTSATNANIKISAVDKTNGIKKINIYIDDELYKTYSYTSNLYDLKTEIAQIELNSNQRSCYFTIEDENGNESEIKSNTITLQRRGVTDDDEKDDGKDDSKTEEVNLENADS